MLHRAPGVADVAVVDHEAPSAHVLLHQARRVQRRILLAEAVLVRAVDLSLSVEQQGRHAVLQACILARQATAPTCAPPHRRSAPCLLWLVAGMLPLVSYRRAPRASRPHFAG